MTLRGEVVDGAGAVLVENRSHHGAVADIGADEDVTGMREHRR
jgi:hypothetical protein